MPGLPGRPRGSRVAPYHITRLDVACIFSYQYVRRDIACGYFLPKLSHAGGRHLFARDARARASLAPTLRRSGLRFPDRVGARLALANAHLTLTRLMHNFLTPLSPCSTMTLANLISNQVGEMRLCLTPWENSSGSIA